LENALSLIVEKLLQKNKVSFDKSELDLQIKSHPSYPSLHSITGVLDHFGIENFALDLPQTQNVYEQLPNSFIAHLKTEQGEELVFAIKKNNLVKLVYPNRKKYSSNLWRD